MKRSTRWFVAVAVVAVALVAVKVGRQPNVSSAAPLLDKRFDDNRPVITRLKGKDNTLTISATGRGAVYSVADAQGKTLLSGASAAELREKHPDLYLLINSTIAGTDTPVIDASVRD
jgi:hypothetical protein